MRLLCCGMVVIIGSRICHGTCGVRTSLATVLVEYQQRGWYRAGSVASVWHVSFKSDCSSTPVSCSQHKLRLGLNYPASTGRFWPEVLRAIDSILLAEKHPIGECVVG